ncbi:MAG TPA: hypothetical protein VOA78_13240 [Candidatus Dormibacteraeota bacterium]|nr:hypothetical protein [Candidatus Dormibacteraeota bacterium]
MAIKSVNTVIAGLGLLLGTSSWAGHASEPSVPEAGESQQAGSAPAKAAAGQDGVARTARGKKLVLKDGNYQVVRDYARVGDRVRYLSAERGEWEELPADMVDWVATAKAEQAEASEAAALVNKIKAQEQANQVVAVMDVDASLQVAPGVFLPTGEGMFAIQGKAVVRLEQAGAGVRTDKKQLLKQIASPIPIVPSKRNVEIPGAKAKVRITTAAPEFYLREAPPDPDQTTTIERSSRPGEAGPEIALVRATVKGNKRQLQAIKNLFGQDIATEVNVIAMQRWEVAPTVYRFTLSEQLPPGEYALAEILPDGMNLFVWDFGVDGPAAAPPAKK